MKKYVLWSISMFVLLLSVNTQAQNRSVRFEEGTFADALNKAKKSGKLLFVDCYTSWCGPCKMLARDVFTNDEVADYFNENFISLKVDCEKGEGPELAKRFGVSGYPTLLFIDGKGEIVNKIVGASQQPLFLEKVKKGLDEESSLFARQKKYDSGYREKKFVQDLIEDYKSIRDIKKAQNISVELLKSLPEEDWISADMWKVIKYYFVSPCGSKYWEFILKHSDEYVSLIGEDEFAHKVGETMHPYLFSYACGGKKAASLDEFKTYEALIDKYQPKEKETLGFFIALGKSASFDSHDKYIKTVLKILPEMDVQEHFRYFTNAMGFLAKDLTEKQKKQLVQLVNESLGMQRNPEYLKAQYEEFVKNIENC